MSITTDPQNYKAQLDEAWREATSHWNPYIQEATKDLACVTGDQWDAMEKAYLRGERRQSFVFNKVQGAVDLVDGYQRANQNSLQAKAVEGADEQTAKVLSKLLQNIIVSSGARGAFSRGFSSALKVGLSSLYGYLSYTDDPLDGDIQCSILPYNRVLYDPNFTELDLRDCSYVIRGALLSKSGLGAILPIDLRGVIDSFRPKSFSSKFPDAAPYGINARYEYIEFWQPTTRTIFYVIPPGGSEPVEWRKKPSPPFKTQEEELRALYQRMPGIQIFPKEKVTVKLCVYVDDIPVWEGPDKNEIDEYPYTPIMARWEPDVKSSKYRLRGIVRDLRDPQTYINRQRSKFIDIMDSQITTGWKAKEDSVVDESALFGSGQGKVVWVKSTNQLTDVERLTPPTMAPGILESMAAFGSDFKEITNVPDALSGGGQNPQQVSGYLESIRQAAAAMGLLPILEPFSESMVIHGRKLMKMAQVHYSANKVKRITGDNQTPEFQDKNFGKYNIVICPGRYTDSQMKQEFGELTELKTIHGIAVPDGLLIDKSSVTDKKTLKDAIAQAQQGAAQAQAQQSQVAMAEQTATIKLVEANAASLLAKTKETMAKIEQSQADMALKIAQTAAEIEKLKTERTLMIAEALQNQGKIENESITT